MKAAARGDSLGVLIKSTASLIDQINTGFPMRLFDNFVHSTKLPADTIADLVQIPSRTLSRRRQQRRLRPDESERLLRLSSIFDKALALFQGDHDAALRWLQTPQPGLGDRTPFHFAKSEIGAREVEDLIGRLEHGVFT